MPTNNNNTASEFGQKAKPVQPGLSTYLPFREGYIAEIQGLDPEDIKASAKSAIASYHSNEDLKPTTAQNHIANSLGIKGGFSNYARAYEDEIVPFMEKNGLRQRQNLFSKEWGNDWARLSLEALSERLFRSGRDIPSRVYTAANMNFEALLHRARRSSDFHLGLSCPFYSDDPCVLLDQNIPPANFTICNAEEGLLEFFHAGMLGNYVGDQLVFPRSHGAKALSYLAYPTEEEIEHAESSADILIRLIDREPAGWVEVLPFNDNLIFLKGKDGGFDFLYPGQKDSPFQHIYQDLSDGKRYASDDSFEKWMYFENHRWSHEDHMNAQKMFRDRARDLGNEARKNTLRWYLKELGAYKPKSPGESLRKGFKFAGTSEGEIAFSPLITNGEFTRFLNNNEDYAAQRRADFEATLWKKSDQSSDLPAAVTWYDAIAYVSWLKTELKCPVRLLSEREYLDLTDDLPSAEFRNDTHPYQGTEFERSLVFYDPNGQPYEAAKKLRPNYMPREEFQRWTLRYSREKLPVLEAKSGLEVIRSIWVSEWLNEEGEAINGACFCGPNDYMFKGQRRMAGQFAPKSDGKYKSMKMCFRVCYSRRKH